MDRAVSGLFLPKVLPLLRHRGRVKTVTLPSGERVKVTWDDSGTVRHTEHDDRLDALVRPKTVRIEIRNRS